MKKQYTVEITELVVNILTVEASSQKEAHAKAMERFQQSDGGTYFAESEIVGVYINGMLLEDYAYSYDLQKI